ncbi:hypothetical protein [Methanonatronarchaeum sp. AMET-Sl]|nr:hypothetical protein [Methanonatronarchaeum sp. AMET-Sl]WGI17670.1 hypothetical protein QEN48_01285 [Methanonatronarchaeum sp. AMET-Sl]
MIKEIRHLKDIQPITCEGVQKTQKYFKHPIFGLNDNADKNGAVYGKKA